MKAPERGRLGKEGAVEGEWGGVTYEDMRGCRGFVICVNNI